MSTKLYKEVTGAAESGDWFCRHGEAILSFSPNFTDAIQRYEPILTIGSSILGPSIEGVLTPTVNSPLCKIRVTNLHWDGVWVSSHFDKLHTYHVRITALTCPLSIQFTEMLGY